jgi:hypothetical protein
MPVLGRGITHKFGCHWNSAKLAQFFPADKDSAEHRSPENKKGRPDCSTQPLSFLKLIVTISRRTE